MNALDSPLEALAFNYLSYGLLTAVNSIWTWVAVITAAVSFWRIKVLSSSSSSSVVAAKTLEHPRGEIPDGSPPVRFTSPSTAAREPEAELPEPASTSHPTTPPFGALEREGSTKGKFTLYYESEDGEGRVDDKGNGEEDGDVGAAAVVEEGWWDRWERVVRMKMGDEEWYSNQDLTVINGSVVRLWEDCRRRNGAPSELVGGVTWLLYCNLALLETRYYN